MTPITGWLRDRIKGGDKARWPVRAVGEKPKPEPKPADRKRAA